MLLELSENLCDPTGHRFFKWLWGIRPSTFDHQSCRGIEAFPHVKRKSLSLWWMPSASKLPTWHWLAIIGRQAMLKHVISIVSIRWWPSELYVSF
jgi:hypothetical protein